jgi:hypothetical protein
VSTLARELGFSAAPLSPAQARALLEIVARHETKPDNGVDTFVWPAVFAEAEAVLQPAQLAELRRAIARERAMQEAFHHSPP